MWAVFAYGVSDDQVSHAS